MAFPPSLIYQLQSIFIHSCCLNFDFCYCEIQTLLSLDLGKCTIVINKLAVFLVRTSLQSEETVKTTLMTVCMEKGDHS